MELGQAGRTRRRLGAPTERGYAMAALLVGLSVMAVMMTMAMPVWSHFTKREKEEELIWRGQQYARAIGLFQRKFANTFPPSIDILVEQKFLRRKYKDPVTDDDFQPIPAGGAIAPGLPPPGPGGRVAIRRNSSGSFDATVQRQGEPPVTAAVPSLSGAFGGVAGSSAGSIGIQGVVSKSKDTSIKMYNGRTKYNEWTFVYLATTQRLSPGGAQQPGVPGQNQQNPSGRPPVPGRPGGSTFTPVGPGSQPSPFGPRPPFGAPGQPPPQRPPGR